jgi:hypothetical protein
MPGWVAPSIGASVAALLDRSGISNQRNDGLAPQILGHDWHRGRQAQVGKPTFVGCVGDELRSKVEHRGRVVHRPHNPSEHGRAERAART